VERAQMIMRLRQIGHERDRLREMRRGLVLPPQFLQRQTKAVVRQCKPRLAGQGPALRRRGIRKPALLVAHQAKVVMRLHQPRR
jgi:hypothetical protein